MQLRTIVCVLAFGALAEANAGYFDVALIEHGGDMAVSISAEYAAPTMNLIQASPAVRITAANANATYTIVTEGLTNDNWWFTGERFMTFDGSCWWSGSSSDLQFVKLTSKIYDLDNGHQYEIVSTLSRTGSNWARDLVFIEPTRHVRWEDTIQLATGPTGTISEWLATRHTMEMAQLVPEPASLAGVGVALIALSRRRRANV